MQNTVATEAVGLPFGTDDRDKFTVLACNGWGAGDACTFASFMFAYIFTITIHALIM